MTAAGLQGGHKQFDGPVFRRLLTQVSRLALGCLHQALPDPPEECLAFRRAKDSHCAAEKGKDSGRRKQLADRRDRPWILRGGFFRKNPL